MGRSNHNKNRCSQIPQLTKFKGDFCLLLYIFFQMKNTDLAAISYSSIEFKQRTIAIRKFESKSIFTEVLTRL